MTDGIDYAFYPHPPVSAIVHGGAHFVGRYVTPEAVNDQNGKNLQHDECKALLDAGLGIILFEEQGATRILAGHAAGVADAQHFDAVVKALGMPSIIMYAAADFDAAPGDQAAINDYLNGVASVIGNARTGLYGGYWPVSRAFNAGTITYGCQTYAWSSFGGVLPPHAVKWEVGGRTYLADSRAQVRQSLQIDVAGYSVDYLQSQTADFGQWPRPAAPKPPAPEWTFGVPSLHILSAGHTSVKFQVSGPAGAPEKPDHYQVFIYKGTTCNRSTLVSSYPPRKVPAGTNQDGGLARHTEYTIHVVAAGKPDSHGNDTHVRPDTFASATFTTS